MRICNASDALAAVAATEAEEKALSGNPGLRRRICRGSRRKRSLCDCVCLSRVEVAGGEVVS